jgi:AP-2 complex subunit alpha
MAETPCPACNGQVALRIDHMNIPGFTTGDQARGLQNFISDIRNCTSREQEQQRIDKELANIRQKFSNSSNLTAYHRKK